MRKFLFLLTISLFLSGSVFAFTPILASTPSSNNNQDRYWVGGTGSWNGTASTKWAYYSGGVGGAPEPTNQNDVYFDGNSGTGTVTIVTTTAKTRNLKFTGFRGTLAGSTSLTCAGSYILGGNMTMSYTGTVTFSSTKTGNTINTSGKTIQAIAFNGVGGGWTLAGNLTNNGKSVSFTNGSFNDGNYNLTIGSMVRNGSAAVTFTKGTGLYTIVGNSDVVDFFGGLSTFTFTDAGQMKFTNNSVSVKNFNINGKTCNNVWVATAGTGNFIFFGSSFYNQIKTDAGRTIKFEHGKTHTFQDFIATGTSTNNITITSDTAAFATLVSSSGTAINTDYCTISNIHFSGATWNAGSNSTDGGGNTGITFP